MGMKLLRLQISSDILSKRGHPRIFEYISLVEIQNVLQYDPTNSFLQAKLLVKEELNGDYQLIEDYATIKFFHILKEVGNEILCRMRIATDSPLWPDLGNFPWAIIPPIVLDPHSLHFNFLISEKIIASLYKFLEENAESFEILAIQDLNQDLSDKALMSPKFTVRQQEVARYAYRRGYFDSPKGISSKEIAQNFEISSSAVTKHLRSATKKAMKFFFA